MLCKPIIKDYHTSYYNIKFNNSKSTNFDLYAVMV